MVDINHKEEIAKIIENHGATRQSTFVAAEILRYLSSMELPELLLTDEEKAKCVVIFDGEVGITASMDKTAEAQLKKLQPIIVAQRAEIDGWNSLEKKLCPPGYTYETYIKKLEGGLIDEERKVVAAFNIEITDLKLQLSTARAETAKELYEEFICPMCYRLNPQHAEMDNGVGCKTCADKESYLAPDKEGGK